MIDERAFIAEVESASAEHFAEILRTANMEQQRAMQVHFGAPKFERLRLLAQQQITRGAAQKKGKVVLLAGILGSEITVGAQKIWFSPVRIFAGDFAELQVDDSGLPLQTSRATGLLRRYYGEIEQTLLRDWDVLSFPFDWRLDIRGSADQLKAAILQRFGSAEGVHLVAHSMGGLVSRCFAQRHPETWSAMGKLIMLGTPNHGSLAITQLYAGMYRLMRVIAAIDVHHTLPQLLQYARLFPGTYQMLPRPGLLKETANPERIFDATTYGALNPPASRLEDARRFQDEASPILNAERMVYIAGSNQPTADGVSDWSKLSGADGYHMTSLGDGTVPHSLGLLDNVPAYYVVAEHSALPDNPSVMAAVQRIMEGETPELPDTPPTARGADDVDALRQQRQVQDDVAVNQARALGTQLGSARGAEQIVLPEEKQIADLAFLGSAQPLAMAAAAGPPSAGGPVSISLSSLPGGPIKPPAPPPAAPALRLNICHCKIEDVGADGGPAMDPKVDAIAVGHYLGVMPVFAELALDRAISSGVVPALRAEAPPMNEDDRDASGLIAQFTQRGLLHGELGRPFFIPDPRDANRLIVVAGMGPVGRFGEPELTVLARETFWSLATMGKRHLASVLIGSGSGNLDTETALRAWLRGVAFAIANRPDAARLQELSFVERRADKAEELRLTAMQLQSSIRALGLEIEVTPTEPIPQEEEPAPPATSHHDRKKKRVATRIAVELQDEFYRFSALSYEASSPERAVKLNLDLVRQANDAISIQPDEDGARGWGSFLFKYLVPGDLQSKLSGGAPIVVACDSNVAQIHWELMVSPDSAAAALGDCFLGLSPGITRQLRNNFEGIPEPPPPSRHTLRVLVIGDTCAENPLPGAAAEAAAVTQLFEELPKDLAGMGRKVDLVVESLIGPMQASCIEVLKRLMTQTYDILHYSGHCVYDRVDRTKSGWLFSGSQRLTANELTRVDRVPPFVFSNACESGVTPSRPDLRTPELAPSFAEAFFGRGVKNFVCTAWPVQDAPAALFASAFYSSLLGKESGQPAFMNDAMRAAREAVRAKFSGVLGWAAYQHYGNPYFRMV
ncbi:MAG TPA: CHAT domain-containing protein [Terriglobales bacterium]|nr:CHAT domain-containing protein [Terriglobales bacterium]